MRFHPTRGRRQTSPGSQERQGGTQSPHTHNPEKARARNSSTELQLNDAAFYRDYGGLCTVFGAQFGEDVADLAFHRLFTYR